MRPARRLPAGLLAALLSALLAAPVPAAAQAPEAGGEAPAPVSRLPESVFTAAGSWDLSREGTNLRCVMMLSIESGPAGRRLHFPAGCRRALPITAALAGWLYLDGTMRLVDRNVRPVLTLTRRPDLASLTGKAETGETYNFVPLDIVATRPPGSAPEGAASAAEAAPEAAAAAAPAAQEAAGARPVPGIYALDRFNDRDVCRLELEGDGHVRILPGCRDGGIEIFGPAGWRPAAGRMTLTAKRGHVVTLVPTGTGAWRRDPETGATLILRPVEP